MTACSSNIFIIFTIYLSFIFHRSHGFEVIQPQNRTVNPDGSASISCEHTANVSSVEDVRLNVISLVAVCRFMGLCRGLFLGPAGDYGGRHTLLRLSSSTLRTDKPGLLCQKGKEDCKNITMHRENPKKWLFIMLNIGPEAMTKKYECEFTVRIDDLDHTKTGTPTKLLPGQKEAACLLQPSPSPCPQFPQPPQLFWIVIGLLALMFLYSCVITSFYIRLRRSNREARNSTYVEMRKAPQPRNPPF